MAETDLKRFLAKLYDNYNLLQVREANYVNSAPIDLINQIDDYEQATDLTEQDLDQEISLDELQAESRGFNLQIDAVVFVPQEALRKPFTGVNPHRGLRKFTEDEAVFFFGRDAAINSLLETVKYLVQTKTSRQVPDPVAVLGASESGKSSLVRAGLILAYGRAALTGATGGPSK